MAVDSMRCPACGAPVSMSFGRLYAVCEYCGTQVKQTLSESEARESSNDKSFIDAISAAIHSIEGKDYAGAIKYADKAEDIKASDPAPSRVKFIAYLPTDFKKAASQYRIAVSRRAEKDSVAMSDEQFMAVLGVFCRNYLEDRDKDIRRMVTTMGRIGPQDIENVRVYEFRKRGEDYETIPELKQAMEATAEQCLSECESSMSNAGRMDGSGWKDLMDARTRCLYRLATILFVNKALASRSAECISKYDRAINQKWEPLVKSSSMGADKRDLKNFRAESSAIFNWVSRYN